MWPVIESFHQVTWNPNKPVVIFCDIDDTILTFRYSMQNAMQYMNQFCEKEEERWAKKNQYIVGFDNGKGMDDDDDASDSASASASATEEEEEEEEEKEKEYDELRRHHIRVYKQLIDMPMATDLEGLHAMMNHANQSNARLGFGCGDIDGTGCQDDANVDADYVDDHGNHFPSFFLLTARSVDGHDFTIQNLKQIGMQNVDHCRIYYTGNYLPKGDYIRNYFGDLDTDNIQYIFIDDNTSQLQSMAEQFPGIQCYCFCHRSTPHSFFC